MPTKIVSEIASSNTHIFTYPTTGSLIEELRFQLANYSFVSFAPSIDSEVHIIIFAINSDTNSLQESHLLSTLHAYLDMALKKKCRFILSCPSGESKIVTDIKSLVKQYSGVYGLPIIVLEAPVVIHPSDHAEKLIQTFIYSHKKTQRSKSPQITISDPIERKVKFTWFNRFSTPLLIFSTALIMSLVSFSLYTYGQIKCFLQTKSLVCAQKTQLLVRTIEPIIVTWPIQKISAYWGIPTEIVFPLIRQLAKAQIDADFIIRNVNENLTTSFNDNFVSNLTQAVESYAGITALLEQLDQSEHKIPQHLLQELKSEVTDSRLFMTKIAYLLPDLPKLAAINSKVVYLILIHDNTENRPSGGYIPTVALITVENAQITAIELFNTNDLDGQLKGNVEPPANLKKYLGEKAWYLRDVGWDLNFSEVSARAMWFIQKELNRKPDVVVAVNLQFLQTLLSEIGEITLPGFSDNITAANLIDNYLTNITADITKQNPMTILAKEIFSKVANKLPDTNSSLIIKVIKLLEDRQIFIEPVSFFAPSISKMMWDGALIKPTCPTTGCVTDLIYATDTNVGVNKINPFIQKDQALTVTVVKHQIEYSYKIKYKNMATSREWPQGLYKNLLRLRVPEQWQITSISLTNPETQVITGMREISGLISLSPGDESEILIKATQPIVPEKKLTYQLSALNQPGSFNDTLKLEVLYPQDWFAVTTLNPWVASLGRLEYNFALTKPVRLEISLVQP